MEFNNNQAIVFTNNIDFKVIKYKPNMYIGQQIELNDSSRKGFACLRYGYVAAFMAIIIFALLTFATIINCYLKSDFYAYVSIDINPSLELKINKKLLVTDVRGLNKDGLFMLQRANYKNMAVNKALLKIIDKAQKNNYLQKKEPQYVLVSAVFNKASTTQPNLLKESLFEFKQKLVKQNIELRYIEATITQRKEAMQNNLSIGRYMLLLHINKNTPNCLITKDKAKTTDIYNLLNKANLINNKEGETDFSSSMHTGDRDLDLNRNMFINKRMGGTNPGFNIPIDNKYHKTPGTDGYSSDSRMNPGFGIQSPLDKKNKKKRIGSDAHQGGKTGKKNSKPGRSRRHR